MSEGKENRAWILKQHPNGLPTDRDVVVESSPIPEPTDGEVLVKNHYISVDPYQRGQMNASSAYAVTDQSGLGTPVPGGGIGTVIKTTDKERFPVGTLVSGLFCWQEYAVAKFDKVFKIPPTIPKLSYAQGILGMPGATAYFGMFRLLEPKKGETLFVSGAAGAVGSIVGQIGKVEGLTVIGSAGSQGKLDWLKELGFDHVINYKGKDVKALASEIKEIAPQGIDCYFDNTGGDMTDAVVLNMNLFGRISICGQIAGYNNPVLPTIPMFSMLLVKQVKAEGFIVTRWLEEWPEAFQYIAGHIVAGRIKARETITEGFENTLKAFLGLFSGSNLGKQMVHLSDPEPK